MEDIAPKSPAQLFQAMCSSQAIQQTLSSDEESEGTVDETMLEALAECYHAARCWETRCHILSIMADKVHVSQSPVVPDHKDPAYQALCDHDHNEACDRSSSFKILLQILSKSSMHSFIVCYVDNVLCWSGQKAISRADLPQVHEALQNIDVLKWVRQRRPNSKWVVDTVTNITFFITKIRGHTTGRGTDLLDYLAENHGLVALDRNHNNGKIYSDNLCFFRALTLHNGCHLKNPERDTKHYYEKYRATRPDKKKFCGRTLYLNLYQHHFSYINDLKKYSKSYCCSRCGKFWKHVGMLHRHERTCEAKVQFKFPGSAYKTLPTIFQLLEDDGFTIPEHLKYFPYRDTFDFECMFSSTTGLNDTEKLTWDAKHIPLSVSVCSNVPEYDQPKCFVSDGDSKQLVKEMVDYLVKISQESFMKKEFLFLFGAIYEKL
ncbi:hypothetical protein OS493_014592 [Desmophyllum pertusum]|uniref:Uncharacterized protein n=1 Tax=Desmophyllum pertusum TaxID=174260 RepID=A0A9X0CL34_9CNID|nr:hypothetical protein OS493_014592 [Desmophyllum pertusum]